MWFALFGGYVTHPTSETEAVEFTVSLKNGVVRSETQKGPATSVAVSKSVKGGIFRYQMLVGFPDTVKPSDILLSECHIRLPTRKTDYFGSARTLAVLWPVTVGGKKWLAFPPWVSESRSPELLPAHLLNDGTRSAAEKILDFGSLGTSMYRSSMDNRLSLPGALSEHVDYADHADATAEIFAPSDSMRILSLSRSPVVVETPAPAPVVIQPTMDTAAKADLAVLEARIVDLQATMNAVARAVGDLATYADVAVARQQARADASAVNSSISAVGDYLVNSTISRKDRITEQAGISLVAGAIANLITS